MRVVALMTVRNEEAYLERTLTHLYQQGVDVCLIDNDSTDTSREIAETFVCKNVCRIESLPYPGQFSLAPILRNEQRLSTQIKADWFIHHDADEIREAPKGMGTLVEAISTVDSEGYTAINFDEFVFLPTGANTDFSSKDFVAEMRYYYFFEPSRERQVNAWKAACGPVDLEQHAGHNIEFHGKRIYPLNFVLRHYIGLSRRHMNTKYGQRRFDSTEVSERGWHRARATFSSKRSLLPDISQLKKIDGCNNWDRSDPWKIHTFLG